jgi:penicillin amidase
VIYFKLGPIKVPFFLKTFQRTKNGWPILPLDGPKGKALVLRWSGFDVTGADLDPLRGIMHSKDVLDADSYLSRVGLPSWNFVFADDQGAIGYRAIGRIPKLKARPAFGIPDEDLSDLGTGQAFPDLMDVNEKPHLLKPTRGYVATANNRQWPSGESFDPGWAQATPFRAFRIEELLKAGGAAHDVESFRQLQCDQQAVDARFVAPLLTGRLRAVAGAALDAREMAALIALETWDYRAGLDCRACGVYRRWVDRLETQLGGNINLLYRLAAVPAGPSPSELDGMLQTELDGALDDLKVDSQALELPQWGDLHLVHFRHLLGAGFQADHPIADPGDEFSVDVGESDWVNGKYDVNTGPSQRLVVEMTSPPTVYSILAGPNADIAHPDPTDPSGVWMRWQRCELNKRAFPLDWSTVTPVPVDF